MDTDATPDATPDAPSRKRGATKPRQEKPYKDFPLFWHVRGYWAKKLDGHQIAYTADWQESLDLWRKDLEASERGKLPPSRVKRTYTVRDAVNAMMAKQQKRMEDSDIADVQLAKYRIECEHFARVAGADTRLRRLCTDEGPTIFRKLKLAAKSRGLVVAERHIYYVRATLDLASRTGLMPPPNYGDEFDPPTEKEVASVKNDEEAEHGERSWSVDELRCIVAGAYDRSPHLLAQTLLGLNGGFGADDCAILLDGMLDRSRGLIRSYRGKTKRKRVVPWWTVTLWAIERSRAERAKPKTPDLADRVFLTSDGMPVAYKTVTKDGEGRVRRTGRCDSIRLAFDDMLESIQAREDLADGRGWLMRLIADGFFNLERTVAEVVEELGRRKANLSPRVPGMAARGLADEGLLAADGERYRSERFRAVEGIRQAVQKRVMEADQRRATGQSLTFVRHKAGFYTLRAMFRTLAVGCGADNDLIAVIKGQKFARPVDEYYLRGDLRSKLFSVVEHVFAELFGGWSSPWPRAFT